MLDLDAGEKSHLISVKQTLQQGQRQEGCERDRMFLTSWCKKPAKQYRCCLESEGFRECQIVEWERADRWRW
ncbi:Hypothetical predicted protein [Xyrichtys novacula]|uniref:Uncharacterized protein n=1 Tax=Xyrichtys novacula TaxID=13765 RepID=A0AAV1HAQ0_XYRNO|nr:Hypothetical predicted protein [Xyrichtys novacula]